MGRQHQPGTAQRGWGGQIRAMSLNQERVWLQTAGGKQILELQEGLFSHLLQYLVWPQRPVQADFLTPCAAAGL